MADYDMIIVGGGAAGMFAAVTAASLHMQVLLFEKNEKLGRKLAITGKGRCNVTNHCSTEEVLRQVVRNPRFLYSALSRLSPTDTMERFEALGVPLKTERGNRVFPVSDRAYDVVDALRRGMDSRYVRREHRTVTELIIEDGRALGVRCGNAAFYAKRVILATGGLSYPVTGSTGDGYGLAEAAGHTIVPCSGSLVPIELASGECRALAGLELRNVAIRLYGKKKKPVYEDFGEAAFTAFGMTGPVVLSASCHMEPDTEYRLLLDLKPALDCDRLDARLLRDFSARSNEPISSCLRALLPAKLVGPVLSRCRIAPGKPVHSISREERTALVTTVKNMEFSVLGKRPVDEAIVTRGGIRVSEVNPKTMESKLLPGLFFAGEILDCDAYTGGFNLQIAWSTAFTAVTSDGILQTDML